MAEPTNGGKRDTVPSQTIQDLYREILEMKGSAAEVFRLSVLGHTQPAVIFAYGERPFQYTVDGVEHTFILPKMNYVGYTEKEFDWIDSFYGSLVRRLESGDAEFMTSPAMQELANASVNGREIWSLRAPADTGAGASDRGGAKGLGPNVGNDDLVQETVVISEDLVKLRRQSSGSRLHGSGDGISEARYRAEFVSRVFHEMLHRHWVHNTYSYDSQRSLVENMRAGFDIDDMQALDRVYGETRNTLLELASSDPALGLSISEINKVWDETTRGALAGAENYRTAQFYRRAARELSDTNINYTRAELDYLESQGLIELKDYPDEVTTREQKEAWKNDKNNYQLDRGFIRGLSRETQEELAQLNVSAVAEGGLSLSEAVDTALDFAREFFANYSSVIGRELGSALGRYLVRDENQATQIGASTVLGVIGLNLGEIVEEQLRGPSADVSTSSAFDDIAIDLRQAGIGAISSFLTAEIFNDLGLEGTLAELGQSLFAQQLSNVIVAIVDGTNVVNALTLANVGQVVGGIIGTRLAAELVDFDTIGGQIGAAVGGAVGTTAGFQMGFQYGSVFGFIGAVIGAFVGYILGGLIGSIFGGTPRSGAGVEWNGKEFAVSGAWSTSGGSKDAAISVATTVAEVVNGVIAATGSNLIDASQIRIGAYGMRKKDFVYWASGGPEAGQQTFRTRNATDLVNHGAAIALYDLLPRLVGGDVFVKRAVAATVAQSGGNPASNHAGAAGSFDMNVLLGNISTAQDYTSYLAAKNQIDVLLAAEPNSAFSAGWAITFARVMEMGLNKRASVDWAGGWNAFLDEKADGVMDGVGFTGAQLRVTIDPQNHGRLFVFLGGDGELVQVLTDTIDNALKDDIVGTAQADNIVVNLDRIASTSGLTINDTAASGAEHIIRIAASIDGGGGDDTIVSGDLGNDLIGGEGNDTLVGGKLDDWLIGDAGNDRLFAGAANHQFVDGDATATSAALNTVSNGDMLDGGDGNDFLYGSLGSDWLRGGAGADTIYGGAGGDIIDGGVGDDRTSTGAPRLFGGGGTDQYVFGYGSGFDGIFDEADNASPGSTQDSMYARLQQIANGTLARNWAGGGDYEVDGSVKGGEDAIAFGAGIGMHDLVLQRSGQDLVIKLTYQDPETNVRGFTGDELVISDWFDTLRRVEWLRFANGEEVRIGDITSFIVGSGATDVIVGTNEADFLYGSEGNDLIYGLAGNDFGFGGGGDDVVAGDGDNDWVAGGLGADKVMGGAGNDTVFGDSGADEVYGGLGSDIVVGGRGDDVVVGGGGNDIFRYQRGDGRDVFIDEYVNNWEAVAVNGVYINGYVRDSATGVVTKNGETYFTGSEWLGHYDYDIATQTYRRHLGAVSGAIAANSGTDYLEFGVGIDVQDLMFRKTGNDLEIAINSNDSDATAFESVADRITLRDWHSTGRTIENFVFASIGQRNVTSWNLRGGAEDADTLNGVGGSDWFTGGGGDDTLNGNGGDDILSGNSGADNLRGHAGNDVLYGGSGNDELDGGTGTDTLIGGDGVDIVSYGSAAGGSVGMRAFLGAAHTNTRDGAGDAYVDIEGVEGTSGTDLLGGDDRQNRLIGVAGNDTLYGGAGDDTYEFNINHGQDVIRDLPFVTEEILNANGELNTQLFTATYTATGHEGELGNETFYYRLVVTHNASGTEVYRSGDRDFSSWNYTTEPPSGASWPSSGWITGTALTNTPSATGNGSQVVREVFQNADGGDDTVEFGPDISLSDLTFQRVNSGADLQITYRSGHSVTIRGQNAANSAIETLQLRDGLAADLTRLVLAGETATAAADLVVGDANANTLQGLGGDDVISGGAGADILRGGDGDDVLEGGTEADTLDGGSDSVTAGLQLGTTDATQSYGDTIRYVRSNAAVSIDLVAGTASGGHAAGDVLVMNAGVSSIENIVGADLYGDTLRGDDRANRLSGLGGNDIIDGRGGDDVLVGGLGVDTLSGGDGEDNLAGEAGADTLRGGNDKDLLAGGDDSDSLYGDAGEDVLSGGNGDDVLRGGTQDDRLGGDAGVDQLYGEDGADQLAGGEGNDLLYGGNGNDVLVGESGNDQLFGEAGDDTYLFDVDSGSDLIVDADGANQVSLGEISNDRVWMTQSGNDLRIDVIGGNTTVTVQNFFAASTPSRMREIALAEHSLFLAYSQDLIDAMTNWSIANSGAIPQQMPDTVSELLASYWHSGGSATPVVQDQLIATNEDTQISGSVSAVDHDEDIVSYTIRQQPDLGEVTIDAATGAWTYIPSANLHGQETFSIEVTDANNNTAIQSVTVDIASVNDAPSDIALAGTLQIEERDHPLAGTLLTPVVLGTLSATDVDYPDEGDFDDLVFSVSDSRFEIVDGTTLRLRAGSALDFETSPTIPVEITVTDRNGAGLSFTRVFTFNVLDRDDYFYGTSGNDTLTGQAGRNLMYGYAGNDTLTGGGANDDIDGGDGADQLFGAGGNDRILGGYGNDTIDGGAGADVLRGNEGADTVIGQDGDDQLYGDIGEDLLQGGLGNDTLQGGTHNDRLEGGAGNDTLDGGDGNDVLIGGGGADRFIGGNGIDTVSYETATAGIILNVTTTVGSAGDAAGDVFQNSIENTVGSAFADQITGGDGNGIFYGGGGDDVIHGAGGNDQLFGDAGNDTLNGGSGNDTLEGGSGADILNGGDDSDTYLMNLNSGADVIYNYDPNGTDIDVLGYQDITREQLWFERSGDDLIVSVVGADVRTTIVDWYTVATANDRANYKIDFILAGDRVTQTIDAEGLVDLMAGYTAPTTQAEFDTVRETPAFDSEWSSAWTGNAPPEVPEIANQTINEDGSISLSITVTDDFTPAAGVTVVAQAVQTDNYDVEDLSIVSAPTVSAPDTSGERTLTVNTRPNTSGQVAIRVTATDAGGVIRTRVFLLTVTAVADTPTVTLAQVATPTAPLTKPTLDSGSWAINLQAALVDQDGSERLEVHVANVPSELSFNAGARRGDGVWVFTSEELPGLRMQGPANWAQDLLLSVTAVAVESTGQTASSAATNLTVVINARPTDISADRTLAFNENTAVGTSLASFLRTDGDVGDTASFQLLNNASGRFALSSAGTLTVGSTGLDYEAGASPTITVRVTDSGGLYRDEDFIVAVNDVNEHPYNVRTSTGGSLAIQEEVGASSLVGWITASDPENSALSYSLANDAGGRFVITSGGQLLTGSTRLNYELSHSYTISVRATDPGGLSALQDFTVNLLPVDERPIFSSGLVTFTVKEEPLQTPADPGRALMRYVDPTHPEYGFVQAGVTASDPEGSLQLRYELVGSGDTSALNIGAVTGLLYVTPRLDYETRSSYSVTARAWDGGAIGVGNYADQVITVNVTNEPEAPTIDLANQNMGTIAPYWSYLGTVVGSDPDGGAVTYELVSAWQYVEWENDFPGYYVSGEGWVEDPDVMISSAGHVYMDLSFLYEWVPEGYYSYISLMDVQVNVRVRGSDGAVSEIMGIDSSGFSVGTKVPYWTPPVVLDLDGDGVELLPLRESTVEFRRNVTADATRTGWIGADDAVLAIDRNGDGAITHGGEISFVDDLPGATSDLEGLAAFDTDHDGSFDTDDARFAEFVLWRDANQDGISQSGELKSLAEHDIVAISLERSPTGQTTLGATDNVITAMSVFTRADGTTGEVGDVVLASDSNIQEEDDFVSSAGRGTGAPTDETPIDEVDRSADNGASAAVPMSFEASNLSLPEVSVDDADAPAGRVANQQPTQDKGAAARPRPWRPWSDLGENAIAGDAELEDYAGAITVQPSALHASLDSVARRRLQMIEAMASFAPEGASQLELQPHRKVDARTLQLLTSVPEIRVM